MNGYSKFSQLLGGCLLQLIPLLLQAQTAPSKLVAPPVPQVVKGIPQHSIPQSPIPLPPVGSAIENNHVPPVLPDAPLITDSIPIILDFWFGFLPGPNFFPEEKMRIWFASTPEIDHDIQEMFFKDMINAKQGKYNSWRETPRGRLALILLLDQFSRHVYRGKPQAFMLDQMAKSLVLEGMQKGDDQRLYPIERAFFYLPLEHSENLDIQNLSVNSYRNLLAESPESIRPQMHDFLQSAIAHQQQIIRFGRFPYRNAILGRQSTPEETIFLMQWRKN